MSESLNFIPNKTCLYFSKLSKLLYVYGLPHLWVEHANDSKLYNRFRNVVKFCIFIFMIMEWGSFFTQTNLSEKQASDQMIYGITIPVLGFYCVVVDMHKVILRDLLYKLAVDSKKIHNDPDIEKQMVRKATLYTAAHACSFAVAVVSQGFDGLMQVIRSGGTFTTIITAWPDVTDESVPANVTRLIIYIVWWIFVIQAHAVYALIISTSIALSHQYRNLHSYLCSLNDIFEIITNTNEINHEDSEQKYEESLKIGIKLHAETLECARLCEEACSTVFSGQILVCLGVLCLLMLQMVDSERTISNALSTTCISVAVLVGTGFLMWNAGDITVEAATIPSALFASGWHHCRGRRSFRVRNMIMIAMMQAEKPVLMRAFGIIDISYPSYLSIVKSSYSVFSLLY